jgi:hypothetical protein
MGDYNIDLLKSDLHLPTSEFLDTNLHHTLLPTINKPTCVTNTTATIIDNIFTNFLNAEEIITRILPTDLSDHFPICYFTRSKNPNPTTPYKPILKRDMSRKNMEKFKNQIDSQSWTEIMDDTNTQTAYTNFQKLFTKIFTQCFPFKKQSTPYRSNLPWLTPGLKKSINYKNRLYTKHHRHPTPLNTSMYKKYRNHLNHLLRIARRSYYQSQLELNKHNLKRSWNIINTVINRKKVTKHKIETLNINGKKSSDPSEMAEFFNSYFTNIGKTLDAKIPPSTTDPNSYISGDNITSIYLRPCSQD